MNLDETMQEIRRIASGKNVRVLRAPSSRSWMLTAVLALVFAGGMASAQVIPPEDSRKTATSSLILDTGDWDAAAPDGLMDKMPASPPANATMTVLYEEKTWAPACAMSGDEMFAALTSGTLHVSPARLDRLEATDEDSFAVASAILSEEVGSQAMRERIEGLDGEALEQFRNLLVKPAPAPTALRSLAPAMVPAFK